MLDDLSNRMDNAQGHLGNVNGRMKDVLKKVYIPHIHPSTYDLLCATLADHVATSSSTSSHNSSAMLNVMQNCVRSQWVI
jgi:hypothetical protein